MKIRTIILLLFLSTFSSIGESQRSYLFTDIEERGDIHRFSFDDGKYWIFRTRPTFEPITQNPILNITVFDECGPQEAHEFTHEGLFGIQNIYFSELDGDTLRLTCELYNRDFHNHNEMGLFSIHVENFGMRYQFFRADNVVRTRSFFIAGSNRYFLHTFLSYTDRPTQYGNFLLDKNFNILKYYENFSEFTITAGAFKVEDGYICATSKHIYKLNLDLLPVWRRNIDSGHFINNMIDVGDGFVFRTYKRLFPGAILIISVVKLDYQGNFIWQTPKLNFGDFNNNWSRLQLRPDGNLDLLIQHLPDSYVSDELYIYTIDPEEGGILEINNTTNNNVIDSFRFMDYTIDTNGRQSILAVDENWNQYLWNVTEEGDCNISTGGQWEDAVDFVSTATNNLESKVDEVYTGTYEWEHNIVDPTSFEICNYTPPAIDLLPEDSLACAELNVYLDLSDQVFPIIWDDGSTDPLRLITESGTYSYIIDYCDVEFGESIEITLENCSCAIYIPNIFSPNDDGKNDSFAALKNCNNITEFECLIYDRWGELVFQSKQPNFQWDGKMNNQYLPNGVYSYLINYTQTIPEKEIKESKHGTISLIR